MDTNSSIDKIIALIYRGSTLSSSWDPALTAIVDYFNASTVCLRVAMRGAHPFEFRSACGPKVKPDVLADWERTQRGIKFSPTPTLGVPEIRNFALDFPNDPITKELLDYDVAKCLTYCFENQDDCGYILAVTRGLEDPEFGRTETEAIRQIGGHFREAVRMRRELVRTNLTAEFQSQALDRLGIAGILIAPFGPVLPLNNSAELMIEKMDCIRLRRFDRLIAVNTANNTELQEYIRKILSGEAANGQTFAMSLDRADGGRPIGVVLSSARSMGLTSNREENCALMFLRDVGAKFSMEASLVQKLFSFTAAEASLAIGLASGRRLDEIEEQMRIRHNTARAHLRSIFVKADVTRQAELVSLLANSVVPLGQRSTKVAC